MKILLWMLSTSLSQAKEEPAKPWLHSYGTPARTFYVAPEATGSGASKAEPMSLASAIESSKAGDLYWLLQGAYKGPVKLANPGTKESPIVFRAFPAHRVAVVGQVVVKGAYTWVWGLEVTDPDAGGPVGESGSLHAGAPGVHFINNIVHDTWHVGIGGWQTGPDHVYYGNILWKVGQHPVDRQRAYPIYTQSDHAKHGFKYIVSNVFLDTVTDVGGPGFNFHAYTQGGQLTGFHLEKNVSRDGHFLIGGKNEASVHIRVIENYFYKSAVQLGYRRPIQAEFRNNYLGRSALQARQFYGKNAGTGVKPSEDKPGPNVYTGNTIVFPEGLHVMCLTAGYVSGNRQEGTTLLDPADAWDGNAYSAPFRGMLRAGGKDVQAGDLAAWRAATHNAGKAFDARSQEIAGTPPNKAVLIPNDYESGRGHLIVYNWDKSRAIKADLSRVLSPGTPYKVVRAKDPFGAPVTSGTYSGPVPVPMEAQEFEVFLVHAAGRTP